MVPLSFWPPMFGPLSRSLKKMTGPPEFGLGGGGGAAAMLMERVVESNEAAGDVESCAFMVNRNTPANMGVPEISPFAASSPWRNPFFLSDGSDNGDSGSFEMDEAAEAKNKGLCYRCTSGSA